MLNSDWETGFPGYRPIALPRTSNHMFLDGFDSADHALRSTQRASRGFAVDRATQKVPVGAVHRPEARSQSWDPKERLYGSTTRVEAIAIRLEAIAITIL